MNAVADDVDRVERRIHGLDKSALECALNAWGNWIEEHSDFEGYPRSDAMSAWLDGAGGGERGHLVLCLDMPVRIYATHARVILLPEEEREAVWAYYVPTMKENGCAWTAEEKALKLGITWGAFRTRLWRARLRILGLPVQL